MGHGHDDHNHQHESHDHGPADHDHGSHAGSALKKALALNLTLLIAELVGGILTGSLALLSDAGHMFVDGAALGLSLFALWVAGKKATPLKTFGYYRAEVLAAFVNCLALWVLMAALFYEAVSRFSTPHPIHSQGMLLVAVCGLVANLVGVFLLHSHRHSNMGLRSSYFHLISDSLGSVAVIIAAVVVHFTGETRADPLASIAVGLLSLYASWGLLKESIDILMESTPRSVELEKVRKAMGSVTGIISVHDLHIWSLGSKNLALSAHVVLGDKGGESATRQKITATLKQLLKKDFHIDHTTIQTEDAATFQAEDCFDCENH